MSAEEQPRLDRLAQTSLDVTQRNALAIETSLDIETSITVYHKWIRLKCIVEIN